MSNPNPPVPHHGSDPSAPFAAPPQNASDSSQKSPRWFPWLVCAALLGFAIFLGLKSTVAAGGSDSSGYLNSARLFAAGEVRTPLRLPPEFGTASTVNLTHFTPLGFIPAPDRTQLAPTYPTGLPLHFAAAARVFGWSLGPRLVIALGAAAALFLCYRIARELALSRALAVSGAVMLGAFPVFLFSSLQPLSDTLATTWCLAATFATLRARRATAWAAASGFALAMAVLVRPTNALYAPALLILLGLDVRRLLAFTAAGLPAAVWFVWYNNYQYGGPFTSGYGDVGSAFHLRYAAPTALNFTGWLATLLPAVVLVLPFFAFAERSLRTRASWSLVVAFVAIGGTYLLYEISHEVWWCLRFILPVVPALILLALLGVEALARGPAAARWPHGFRPAAALLLSLWAVALSVARNPGLHVFMVPRYEQVYEDTGRAVLTAFPPNAVVTCSAFSGSVYFYTDFPVLRSDMVNPPDFQRYTALARASGRPLCALVFEWEEPQLRERCPGNWKRLGGVANVGFWQLE